MLLTIDVGNTNVVFALFDATVKVAAWRCGTDERRTADEYGVWLLQLMHLRGLAPDAITAAIVGSVVPGITFNIRKLCRDYFHCEPLMVGDPAVVLGIRVLMDQPSEVGADRLVNAVAAVAAYTAPLIVVDFGTATTFDVINGAGDYCGGAIAPGINLALETLHRAAAKLPRVDIVQPREIIGKNTISAMQSGIYWGYIGLIEGLTGRMRADIAKIGGARAVTVIATGGLAGLLSRSTTAIDHVDPDLTLKGLALIHQRNGARAAAAADSH